MSHNYTLLYTLLVILMSCNADDIENISTTEIFVEEKSMNDTGVPIPILIDSIENYGSIEAFNLLETESMDFEPGTFLSTFLIMADKYNNDFACMNVYYHVLWMNNTPHIEDSKNGIFQLDSINNNTKDIAIKYLIKADSLGNTEAARHLEEYNKFGLTF